MKKIIKWVFIGVIIFAAAWLFVAYTIEDREAREKADYKGRFARTEIARMRAERQEKQ